MHTSFFRLSLPALLCAFLLSGCAVKVASPSMKRIEALSSLLMTLDSTIPKEATIQLAKEMFKETQILTKAFEMTSPPQYHNFLVSVGLKKRGLCYHWADALYIHFISRHYHFFSFHLMGAHIGEYWREHNVMAVAAKDTPMQEWIIVDPWREPGKLYFSKVKDDPKYRWRHRVSREFQKGR